MSDALHVVVKKGNLEGEEGEWYRADVVLNGESVATGYCPDRNFYKRENIARKSAISIAINKFAKDIGKDIRDASEAS